MARRILWSSLALAPVSILVHYAADVGETAEFVLAAAALIPLAWLIGEATEHAAEHTGPGIGGFLNATFGNAPELIIALLAVHQGLTEVVRGSLTGSVVSNLLLVLGASLVAGGRGTLDRYSSFLAFGLLGLATLVTVFVAEILVGSLEVFADRIGVSEFFVAAVIVAVVGNAAEHGGAGVVAFPGENPPAGGVAL